MEYLYRTKDHINSNLILPDIFQGSHSIPDIFQVVDLSGEPLAVIWHELCDFVHAMFVFVIDAVAKKKLPCFQLHS